MRWYDRAFALLVVFIWGVNFVAIRMSVQDIPPLLTLMIRFMLVAAISLPWILRLRVSDVPMLFLLGLVNGIGYTAVLFIGMQGVSASETVILVQLQVPISIVLAHLVFKDQLNKRMILGVVIAFIGVIITIGLPSRLGTAESVACIVIATFFWAIATLLMRKMKSIHPMTLNGSQALFAILPLYVLTVIHTPDAMTYLVMAHWQAFAAIGFTALFSSLVAYTLWMYLLGKYRVNQVTPYTLIEPIFGVMAGVIVLSEPFFPHMAVGALVCAVGLYLVVCEKRSKNNAKQLRADLECEGS